MKRHDDEELTDVVDLLDGLGEVERAELEAARAEVGAPGRAERALLAAMEAEAGEGSAAPAVGPRPAGRRGTLARSLPLAAAVLLGVWLGRFLLGEPGRSTQDDLVMGGTVEALSPQGEVDDFSAFRFEAELGGGVWARIVVHDAQGRELVRSGRLREPLWPVDEATQADWEAIAWTVELYDGEGSATPFDRASATARRSSR